jgi:hypothetical protein
MERMRYSLLLSYKWIESGLEIIQIEWFEGREPRDEKDSLRAVEFPEEGEAFHLKEQ